MVRNIDERKKKNMHTLLAGIWRLFSGALQWRILWLAHAKFMIGVSGVVLNDHGQILLLRHRFWRVGTWGLPSGYANPQEHLEDTLCREVREETGYEVKVTRFLRMVSGFRLRLEVSYLGTITGGVCRLDPKEVIEARFFAQDALPTGLLPSHRQIIALAFADVDISC